MAELHKQYSDKGLNVMCFPCNQFGGQEPGTPEEIKSFVSKYGVNPPQEFFMSEKIKVNGKNTHPVYIKLKEAFPGDIRWNFASAFLVNRDGQVVGRYNKPDFKALVPEIEALLKEAVKDAPPAKEDL